MEEIAIENELTDPSMPAEDEFVEPTGEDSQADVVVAEEPIISEEPVVEGVKQASEVQDNDKAQDKEKLKAEAVLEAFKGIINPFTGEEIKDNLDVDEYKTMLGIQKSGGDPVADYAKTVKKQSREAASANNNPPQSEDFLTNDGRDFREANPDVDIAKLFTDDKFMRFAGARLGKESMTNIYNDWIFVASEFSKTAEKTAKTKAESMAAKSKASPGSLGGGADINLNYSNMPDADFDRKVAAVLAGKETL